MLALGDRNEVVSESPMKTSMIRGDVGCDELESIRRYGVFLAELRGLRRGNEFEPIS